MNPTYKQHDSRHAPAITTTEPLTFILPCKDLGLFPQVNGGKDVGSNGDVGRCHVLDAGRDPAAPHTASTRLGAHGAGRRHWRERGWCACASGRWKIGENWLITKPASYRFPATGTVGQVTKCQCVPAKRTVISLRSKRHPLPLVGVWEFIKQ